MRSLSGVTMTAAELAFAVCSFQQRAVWPVFLCQREAGIREQGMGWRVAGIDMIKLFPPVNDDFNIYLRLTRELNAGRSRALLAAGRSLPATSVFQCACPRRALGLMLRQTVGHWIKQGCTTETLL